MEQTLIKAAAVVLGLLAPFQCSAQVADFKIAWTTVGKVFSSAGKDTVLIQPGTKIARVDVQPAIVQAVLGKQICIGSLQVQAFDADRRPIAAAPLEVSVREDQRPELQITHTKGVCMRPTRNGEYPIRFTSKTPAPDDTLRGAQIFLRVP
jgi:hypothetical protein